MIWLGLLALLAIMGSQIRAEWLLHEAATAFRRRRWADAFEGARSALRLRPFDPRGSALAARSLSRLNRAVEAEPYYRQAGPLGLEDAHVRAQALILAERFDDAGRVLEEILRRHPRDLLALSRLAGLRIARRRWNEALALADRLIADPTTEVIGRTLAGTVHHNRGEYHAAIAHYQRVLALDPDLVQMPLRPPKLFWEQLAYDLLAESRVADARATLERGLARQEDPALLDLLGRACRLAGDLDAAEACWRRAIALDPGPADPWLELGRLALNRGDYPEAVRRLTRAAALAPESVDPLYNLARAHRLLGHRADADEVQRRIDRLRRPEAKRP